MRTDAGITDVVFDFCGVLVDRQVARSLEGFYAPEQIAEYFAYDDRSGFHYFEDLLDRGVGISEVVRRCEAERGARLAQMLRCAYEHADRGLTRLVPGIEGLLADLRRAGVRAWGLTNMASRTFRRMYDRFPQLRDVLSDVLVSADVRLAKPDRRIFELAGERFGLEPARALFVDDSSINVAAAERAGMRGATFVDVPRLREDLRSRGVDVPPAAARARREEEKIMYTDHDGATACTTAAAVREDCVLTPDNQGARGSWCALPLRSIALPERDERFWAERCREYRALQWPLMDWGFVQEQLQRAADRLGTRRCAAPEVVLPGRTERERTFFEQWFGYGDAPCAVRLKAGRLEAVAGQHRIRAVANLPLRPEDAELLGLAGGSFGEGDPLPGSAKLPVLVME